MKQTFSYKLALSAAYVILIILILFPLGMILAKSFMPDDTWEWLAPLQVILSRDLSQVYINSLILGLTVVIGATLIAAPIAFLMSKTSFRRHWWLELVLLIPFMTPPYIGSMGWILFMQTRGFRDQFFPWLSFTQPLFFSFFGIVLVMSFHLFPFIYLVLRNTMNKLSGNLEEAGAIHGAGFIYRLRKIFIPLIFSSYTMGALLIFVKTISEFGTPATLGKRVGFYVLTTEIHRFTSTWPIDFGKAAALSSILLGTSMLIWAFQNHISERYKYQTIGGKGQREKVYVLGNWSIFAWGYVGFILILSIGIPYFSILSASLLKQWGFGLSLSNLTLAHYSELLRVGSAGFKALSNSVTFSFYAASAAMVIGTYLALVGRKSKGFHRGFIDVSSLLSNTVPGIVIIVALILFWNAPWMNLSVYNTKLILPLTYLVLFLPYTVQYVKASYNQIGHSLLEAAMVSGAKPTYTLSRITFPFIWPGMLAGWMMTFIISVRELVGSLIIRPPGVETTATFIFSQFEQGTTSLGMAMAVSSVGITTILLLILQAYQRKSERSLS